MSDHVKLSDLLKAEEEALLEDGETYEFDIDLVESKTSRKGDVYLRLTLVVAEGAKEGTEVQELLFWPKSRGNTLSFFKRKLTALGLSVPLLIENGIDSAESLPELVDVLEGLPVAGKATVKEAYNSPGDKENGVFLNRSERLDPDKVLAKLAE